MHGMQASTDLSFLKNREVLQVAVGTFQTLLHLDGDVTLTLEGDCEVGTKRYGPGVETGRVLLDFIGGTVADVGVVNERHLQMTFRDGRTLTLVESDEPAESYSIAGPGITIVV